MHKSKNLMLQWQVELSEGLRSHKGGRHQVRLRHPATSDRGQVSRVVRAWYAQAETGFRNYLQSLYGQWTAGTIEDQKFYRDFSETLYRYQVKMYTLGKWAVGDKTNTLTEIDKKYLHGQHSREMKYFNNFMRQMKAGQGRMPYPQRLDLYGLSGYSIYLRGAVIGAGVPEDARIFWWDVNPEAEHCDDCIRIEKLCKERGGFTLQELLDEIGLPGERTACGNKCRCGLRLVGGSALPRTRPTAFIPPRRNNNEKTTPKGPNRPAYTPTTARAKRRSQQRPPL